MKNPLVSIIILNFNGLKDTINCLNSLEKTKYQNFEILVIDNGSYTNEAKVLQKTFGEFIKAYRLKENKGFTGGNNWALSKVRGKYIVLLNNDTVVVSNWLTPLVETLESDKKIAVVQPKIKLMRKKNYFDYAGAGGGFIDKYGYPFTRGRIFETKEKDFGQYDFIYDIFWASGAGCIIRKSVIKEVGGLFSENLFNYMEEIDFCWRIWRAGYKVTFTPNSTIYHKVAESAKKDLFKKRYWEHRNNLIILTRNLSRLNFLKIFPVRAFLEISTYLHYLLRGEYIFLKSLFFAHLDYLKNILPTRISRTRIKKASRAPIYPRSIVFDYFISGKKVFSSLDWSPKGSVSYLIFDTKENTGSKVVFTQINRFIEKGYNVKAYSFRGREQSWFPLKTKVNNFSESYFHSPPDILVATFWPTAYLSLLMKGRNKLHFIQDWEETFHRNPIVKAFSRFTYTLPTNKIVISKYLYHKVSNYDKSQHPTHHVKYAVLDTSVFNKQKARYDNNKKSTVDVLSVVSWYNQHKGPDILEKVAIKLKEKHKNYRFTLVSREREVFAPVFDHFYSNPKPNTIADLYRRADILLATSRTEGFFIPGLEAMACGCPFVTTNSRGVLDYAKSGINAIIVDKPEEIWKKDIIENLLKNPSKISKLRKEGYKTAEKYTINNIIDELEKIFFKNK